MSEQVEWSEPEAVAAAVSAPVTPADTADAARLVAFGLQPKTQPARDQEYAELLRRYREDPPSHGSPTPWPPGSGSSSSRCPRGPVWR